MIPVDYKNRNLLYNPDMKHYDILIIGAGASGLAAAAAARMENEAASIAVLDKNDRAGRKLYATGNGRCNLSNMACGKVTFVMDFFTRLGLSVREEEEGRLYPASGKAADVVCVLETYLLNHGVDLLLKSAVSAVERAEEGFLVTTAKGKLTAEKVLLATGGKAGPQYGTVGDGYALAKSLGHTVTALYPVLTGLEAVPPAGSAEDLAGLRVPAVVTLLRKGSPCFIEEGQVQFTKYGLSGIVIFNASRHVRMDADTKVTDYTVLLDLAPGIDPAVLKEQMATRKELGLAPLRSQVPEPLDRVILDSGEDLKALPFAVTGVKGWKMAQSTGGGIPLAEVEGSMASKIVPGLYLAGELLEGDQPCGGYNLQQAWQTGITAGRAMAHV